MALFGRDEFAKPDDEAGVFIDGLGRALVTWAAMQDRTVTVAEASRVFNTTTEVITEAISEASWIYITGPEDQPQKQMIELDGA